MFDKLITLTLAIAILFGVGYFMFFVVGPKVGRAADEYAEYLLERIDNANNIR